MNSYQDLIRNKTVIKTSNTYGHAKISNMQ